MQEPNGGEREREDEVLCSDAGLPTVRTGDKCASLEQTADNWRKHHEATDNAVSGATFYEDVSRVLQW